jgi:hypothetical protein
MEILIIYHFYRKRVSARVSASTIAFLFELLMIRNGVWFLPNTAPYMLNINGIKQLIANITFAPIMTIWESQCICVLVCYTYVFYGFLSL